jgi:hypothetical protein
MNPIAPFMQAHKMCSLGMPEQKSTTECMLILMNKIISILQLYFFKNYLQKNSFRNCKGKTNRR